MSDGDERRKRRKLDIFDGDGVTPLSESSSDKKKTPSSTLIDELVTQYACIDAYRISRDYRTALRKQGNYAATESLQYGEIDLLDFAKILETLVAPNFNLQQLAT